MSVTFYTVDVGHGLCQVIRFGDRAVLIDGGGRLGKRVAEDFLKRYVKVIVAYIATHNDRDHVGAAPELLDRYSSASTLNSIWLLLDRPAREQSQPEDEVIPFLTYSKRRWNAKTIGAFHALYVDDLELGKPRVVHRENKESAELQLLYPKILDTTGAILRGKPSPAATNQVSAILRLALDGSKSRASVLITGDANCQSFHIARDEYGFDLSARVLTVPHHGGEVPVPAGSPDWATIVKWVAPEIAVVSAGFGNVPRSTTTKRETFDPLRQPGITTCCTQLTKYCHPEFNRFHPSVQGVLSRPLPQMSGHRDFPDAVGCAGTIAIKVSSTGDVNMVDNRRHQAAVDQKIVPERGCPHCREMKEVRQ